MKRPTHPTRTVTGRRTHHALPTPLPVTGSDHPGLPLPMSKADLRDQLPLRGFTAAHPGTCYLCQRFIAPGDTVFIPERICGAPCWEDPVDPEAVDWHACWECGSGLMIFHGYWTINHLAKCGPIMGADATAPDKECRSGTNGIQMCKAAPAIAPPASGQPGG